MKITLNLEIVPEFRAGGKGSSKRIVLFNMTREVNLTAESFVELYKNHSLSIGQESYRIDELTAEDGKVIAHFFAQLDTVNDNIPYYKNMVKEGWIAVAEDAEIIREYGYKNFFPEQFI